MKKGLGFFLLITFLAGLGWGALGCARDLGGESTGGPVVEKPRREGSGYQ